MVSFSIWLNISDLKKRLFDLVILALSFANSGGIFDVVGLARFVLADLVRPSPSVSAFLALCDAADPILGAREASTWLLGLGVVWLMVLRLLLDVVGRPASR